MKKLMLLIATLCIVAVSCAQGEYNYQRRSLFEVLPIHSNDIVFLGNSIIDGCEWAELFDNRHVKNRGISGDRSGWMLDRIDTILGGHPKKLFLMIGVNDLSVGIPPRELVANVRKLIDRFQAESRWTKVYIQSLLPVNGVDIKGNFRDHYTQAARIVETNKLLQALCLEKGVTYLDVYSALVDHRGLLDKRYTNDGLHLTGDGYLAWKEVLKPYVK